MKEKICCRISMIAAIGILAAVSASGQYRVKAGVFGSGGGWTSSSETRIGGTAGQAIAGKSETGASRTFFGFWHVESALVTGVEMQPPLPLEFRLEQNYPNPFNPQTTIVFHLPEPSPVRLEIYNVTGKHLRTLIPGLKYEAGIWETVWDGRDAGGLTVSSGVYITRLTADRQVKTRKMTLLK
ncbi:MAG TPA: T9SS type A sorting domain-containing protein [bacterium]|nr:T9SS type A sorting domain-containing protein [bacterium]